MCGLLLLSGAAHRGAVERARDLVRHRGVRMTTLVTPHGVTLVHSRLPIVGLGVEYDQPVRMDDGSYFMFVGELLNFRSVDPRAECDLTVAIRTWRNEGPEGFRKFDGFWSVVVLSNDVVHLLCDYLGQKPLYYRTDGILAVASEPQAVAAVRQTTPDELYLADVAKWGYCPNPRQTPYREVRRVMPGEHVRLYLRSGAVASREVVDQIRPAEVSGEEARSLLRRAVVDAVRLRVQSSDVPVACLVSGGLDSAITYALAEGCTPRRVRPYYVHEGSAPDDDEFRRVAEVVGSSDYRSCAWSDVSVDEALRIMGEPIDLGSLLPQLALARAVEESVCLTGDGADESFGGYGRAQRYDSMMSDVFRELVCWHLPRLDRVMMSERVEVRSPFLARQVCELAMALPREDRTDKRILRSLFADVVPQSVIRAPKVPLRTSAVAQDREAWSLKLVEKFRRATWGPATT